MSGRAPLLGRTSDVGCVVTMPKTPPCIASQVLAVRPPVHRDSSGASTVGPSDLLSWTIVASCARERNGAEHSTLDDHHNAFADVTDEPLQPNAHLDVDDTRPSLPNCQLAIGPFTWRHLEPYLEILLRRQQSPSVTCSLHSLVILPHIKTAKPDGRLSLNLNSKSCTPSTPSTSWTATLQLSLFLTRRIARASHPA